MHYVYTHSFNHNNNCYRLRIIEIHIINMYENVYDALRFMPNDKNSLRLIALWKVHTQKPKRISIFRVIRFSSSFLSAAPQCCEREAIFLYLKILSMPPNRWRGKNASARLNLSTSHSHCEPNEEKHKQKVHTITSIKTQPSTDRTEIWNMKQQKHQPWNENNSTQKK